MSPRPATEALGSALRADVRTLEGLGYMASDVEAVLDAMARAVTRAHERYTNSPYARDLGELEASLEASGTYAGIISERVRDAIEADGREGSHDGPSDSSQAYEVVRLLMETDCKGVAYDTPAGRVHVYATKWRAPVGDTPTGVKWILDYGAMRATGTAVEAVIEQYEAPGGYVAPGLTIRVINNSEIVASVSCYADEVTHLFEGDGARPREGYSPAGASQWALGAYLTLHRIADAMELSEPQAFAEGSQTGDAVCTALNALNGLYEVLKPKEGGQ